VADILLLTGWALLLAAWLRSMQWAFDGRQYQGGAIVILIAAAFGVVLVVLACLMI
jgi:hypothetical protein